MNDTDNNDLSLGFDIDQVEEVSNEPIPAGWRTMEILEIKKQRTRDETGSLFAVTLAVTQGEDFGGRRIWSRFLAQSSKTDDGTIKSLSINRGLLKQMIEACGQRDDLSACIGQRVDVKVGVRPARGEYEASNEAKGFRAVGVVAPQRAAAGDTAKPASKGIASAAPPAFMRGK